MANEIDVKVNLIGYGPLTKPEQTPHKCPHCGGPIIVGLEIMFDQDGDNPVLVQAHLIKPESKPIDIPSTPFTEHKEKYGR